MLVPATDVKRTRILAVAMVLLEMVAAGCAMKGGTLPSMRHPPTVTVTCVVLTVQDGPIAGARCQSEGVGATTDAYGLARLRGVPVGDRLLVVTASGFDAGSQAYTVFATDLTVRVQLVRSSQ